MLFRSRKNTRRRNAPKSGEEAKAASKRRGDWLLRIGLGLALTAGAVFGAKTAWDWARVTPSFALQRVRWEGLKRATAPELANLATLSEGLNLFAFEPQTAERAMETHPWIAQARVSRRFPHELVVRIEEHDPVALVSLGDLYVLDSKGQPFKRVQAGDALDLPLLTGVSREEFVSRADESQARVLAALAVASEYSKSQAGEAAQLSEVRLEGDETVLVTGKGQEVRFGEGGVEEKLKRLQRVREELARRSLTAEVIHLDNRVRPSWVTVQLSSGAPEKTPRSVK